MMKMKRFFVVICAVLISAPVFGQKAERSEPNLGELMLLLKGAGYELFSFDVEGVAVESFEMREYAGGVELPNRKYVSGGLQSGEPINRINIGLRPGRSDSLAVIHLDIPGVTMMGAGRQLRPLVDGEGRSWYNYNTRPFRVGEVEDGFLPLVLFGSSWADGYYDGYPLMRFCGESEIDPDLSSDILKNIPHYYVIGVNVKKTK